MAAVTAQRSQVALVTFPSLGTPRSRFVCTLGAAERELSTAAPHNTGGSKDDAKLLLETSKDNQMTPGHFNAREGQHKPCNPLHAYTPGRSATANTPLLSLSSSISQKRSVERNTSLLDTSPHATLGKLESRCPSPALPAPHHGPSTRTAFYPPSLFSRSSFLCMFQPRLGGFWAIGISQRGLRDPQQNPTLHESAKHQLGSIYGRRFEERRAAVAAARGAGLSSWGRS